MSQKTIKYLGWIASGFSLMMYVSYIVQIIANLNGRKGNFVQPMVATLNCILWTVYGLNMKPKEWPVVIANAPGIILAAAACFTSL